jgi:pimeloyl-ACP methyl ester carboxylesterase
MATFVLVHGGWSGAHGFRKVRPLLRAAGHEVFTPSLTGIGERAHLTSPSVNLTTHIRDVVNVVLCEDLDDITLLGFAHGGMVVTGTLDHIADGVRHLVYLDAFVPASSDTVAGLAGRGVTPTMTLNADWLVPPPPREFDDARRSGLAERASHAAPARSLHRASPSHPAPGALFVHPHLHQSHRGEARRPGSDVSGQQPRWPTNPALGGTGRSRPPTWSPATARPSSLDCCSNSPEAQQRGYSYRSTSRTAPQTRGRHRAQR